MVRSLRRPGDRGRSSCEAMTRFTTSTRGGGSWFNLVGYSVFLLVLAAYVVLALLHHPNAEPLESLPYWCLAILGAAFVGLTYSIMTTLWRIVWPQEYYLEIDADTISSGITSRPGALQIAHRTDVRWLNIDSDDFCLYCYDGVRVRLLDCAVCNEAGPWRDVLDDLRMMWPDVPIKQQRVVPFEHCWLLERMPRTRSLWRRLCEAVPRTN